MILTVKYVSTLTVQPFMSFSSGWPQFLLEYWLSEPRGMLAICMVTVWAASAVSPTTPVPTSRMAASRIAVARFFKVFTFNRVSFFLVSPCRLCNGAGACGLGCFRPFLLALVRLPEIMRCPFQKG